jgi:hypothetical protein
MTRSHVWQIAAAFALAMTSHGQTSRGTVSGTILDASGAVVAGARVVLTDVETGTAVHAQQRSRHLPYVAIVTDGRLSGCLHGSKIIVGFTRYEYYLENFTGMLHLACALILLRHL